MCCFLLVKSRLPDGLPSVGTSCIQEACHWPPTTPDSRVPFKVAAVFRLHESVRGDKIRVNAAWLRARGAGIVRKHCGLGGPGFAVIRGLMRR